LRSYAWNGAQKLTYIDDMTPQIKNTPRLSLSDVGHVRGMPDQDLSVVAAVSAIDHLENGRLAGARGSGKSDAFAGLDLKRYIGKDGKANSPLQMHGESFGHVGKSEGEHVLTDNQGGRIEETSNWV
jgi:hypothetical protein